MNNSNRLCWPHVRFLISNLNFHQTLLLRKWFLLPDQVYGHLLKAEF